MSQVGDDRTPEGPEPGASVPPPDQLGEALRELGATARTGLGAAGASAKAMRSLVAADLALARSALGRALAFVGVAIVFGASAWLFLMGSLVALLTTLGLSWLLAMLIAALLSLAVTGYACWRAMHYFDHTRLQATRRQLARLGIGDLADFMPGPGSEESARDAAKRHEQSLSGRPKKDEQGIDVAPP
ncbi:phage holin family protein [Lysobacter sp. TAF61]|uniref:phage holin family protein n=1 Tax=Lysobacter sp. TAF61 TaxID=3233072 RepID=UPI003F99179D